VAESVQVSSFLFLTYRLPLIRIHTNFRLVRQVSLFFITRHVLHTVGVLTNIGLGFKKSVAASIEVSIFPVTYRLPLIKVTQTISSSGVIIFHNITCASHSRSTYKYWTRLKKHLWLPAFGCQYFP
jgi:hypothetical protein